jgi:UDP-N-acetylglucosamine 2-epimerase (non-hydrolysing)
MLVFGTRPEVIKLAPVALAMKASPKHFECLLVTTGQHRELGRQALQIFGLRPDVDLDLMSENQGVTAFLAQALISLDRLIEKGPPDWILVQGDAESALAGAIAGYNRNVPVAHVEAGLRTYDLAAPHPEEGNRQMISRIASLHFAPTIRAQNMLLAENTSKDRVLVTGNTVVDAVNWIRSRFGEDEKRVAREATRPSTRLVLVTIHRRESFGEPLIGMLEAIRTLAQEPALGLRFVLPVHPNPQVARVVNRTLGQKPNVVLMPPLDYKALLTLMAQCWLILTDSGGLQEEGPCLSVPVLVLRNRTERQEGVDAGVTRVVGTDREKIIMAVTNLVSDAAAYRKMQSGRNPYGDGRAAEAILNRLL